MTQAPATPELVERLNQLSALEGSWYANVGKRTGEMCCATMREAADALEAQQARIAELEAVLTLARDFAETEVEMRGAAGSDMSDYQNEAQEVVDAIDQALSSQGRREGGAFDLLKMAEVATKAVYTHGFGFRAVVGPSERDGKVYVNFAWDDDRLVRAIFFVAPGESPSPDNTNPKAGAPEHG